jgi:hypothetical protein
MAFTVHLNPDHVRDLGHPENGWLNDSRPEPEKGYLYKVELDLSTGLEGWTRLTDEEVVENEKRVTAEAEYRADAQAKRDADLEALRAEAKDNPAFAALLRRLGVDSA